MPTQKQIKYWKSLIGKKRPPFSKEWRDNMSKRQLGKKSALGKTYKQTEETKDKHRKVSQKLVEAGKHNFWKGGITKKSDYIDIVKKRKEIKLENIAGRKKPNNCEICGAMGKICFDHDHKTGKFRGCICSRCNLVLGMVKDNIEILIALSEYLR